MGCDIYIFIEEQDESGKWRLVEEVEHFWRSYTAFALLGYNAPRPEVEPTIPLRGLPEDVSDAVRKEMDGLHSRGWLTAEEIMGLPVATNHGFNISVPASACIKSGVCNCWQSSDDDEPFSVYLEEALKCPRPRRFVFAFDG